MKNILISNIEKIKTTPLGAKRIRKNLGIECNEVEFCKKQILKKECFIEKIGKNFYCYINNIKITINSFSFTIITAHLK